MRTATNIGTKKGQVARRVLADGMYAGVSADAGDRQTLGSVKLTNLQGRGKKKGKRGKQTWGKRGCGGTWDQHRSGPRGKEGTACLHWRHQPAVCYVMSAPGAAYSKRCGALADPSQCKFTNLGEGGQ